MILTSDELLFLTSIVSKKMPFGIIFEKVKPDEGRNSAKRAKEGLINKGILKEDGLTEYGSAFMLLLEQYIEAKKFVIIDRCIIAVIDGRLCVAATRCEEGFEISSGDASFIILECLKKFEGLRRADKEKTSSDIMMLNYEDFRNKAQLCGENLVSVGIVYLNKSLVEERIFYWDSKEIRAYNPSSHEDMEINPSYARIFMASGLGINTEGLVSGR